MCFSAAASYTASAALFLCGIITLTKAKDRMRMFAAVPLLFAIQQFLEGITWQAIAKGGSALLSTYGYLFFVFIVWPLWIPLAARSISSSNREGRLLTIPLAAGAFVAILALVCAAITTPVTVITCNSLKYIGDLPAYIWPIGTIAYLIATISPFFIVRRRYFWIMGIALAISYLLTFILYQQTLLSVWCFFAAILSVLTLLLVW